MERKGIEPLTRDFQLVALNTSIAGTSLKFFFHSYSFSRFISAGDKKPKECNYEPQVYYVVA